MLANLAALWRYRDLLRNLVARDLAVKYKGSTLGIAWSLLNPLVMAAVYTLAFRFVIRIDIERFPLFLLSGLVPWTFFAASLAQATGSVADHGSLVRKVAFPRLVLPAGALLSQFVQFGLTYLLIVPLSLVLGGGWSPALVAIVPIAILQLLFTAGVALVLATAYVFFRDTRHLLDVAVQIWFWLTPIVYAISLVPAPWRSWFALNPMALFIGSYHLVVLDHVWPSMTRFGALGLTAAASFGIGLAVFSRYQRRFAELV